MKAKPDGESPDEKKTKPTKAEKGEKSDFVPVPEEELKGLVPPLSKRRF